MTESEYIQAVNIGVLDVALDALRNIRIGDGVIDPKELGKIQDVLTKWRMQLHENVEVQDVDGK